MRDWDIINKNVRFVRPSSLPVLLAAFVSHCLFLFAFPAQAEETPPVAKCTYNNIRGVWELANLREKPQGKAFEYYRSFPYQYAYFPANQRYAKVRDVDPYRSYDALNKEVLNEMRRTFEQYVLTDSSLLYLYKDKVATEFYHCAYVLETKLPYRRGDLLLHTPNGASRKVMYVYRKPDFRR